MRATHLQPTQLRHAGLCKPTWTDTEGIVCLQHCNLLSSCLEHSGWTACRSLVTHMHSSSVEERSTPNPSLVIDPWQTENWH